MIDDIIKWIKKHKLFTFLIFIIVIFIIFLPSIILSTSNIGIIDLKDSQTVLEYYGSIIGGALTVIGVLITIKSERNINIEVLAYEHKPCLEIDYIDKSEEDENKYYLEVTNTGLGEAVEISCFGYHKGSFKIFFTINLSKDEKHKVELIIKSKYEKLFIAFTYRDITKTKLWMSVHEIFFDRDFNITKTKNDTSFEISDEDKTREIFLKRINEIKDYK